MRVKPENSLVASSNNNKNSEGSKAKKLKLESETDLLLKTFSISKEPEVYKFTKKCKTNALKSVDQNELKKLKNLLTKGKINL